MFEGPALEPKLKKATMYHGEHIDFTNFESKVTASPEGNFRTASNNHISIWM
jgi:hypothetical protein